jgi:hypothetical protein
MDTLIYIKIYVSILIYDEFVYKCIYIEYTMNLHIQFYLKAIRGGYYYEYVESSCLKGLEGTTKLVSICTYMYK